MTNSPSQLLRLIASGALALGLLACDGGNINGNGNGDGGVPPGSEGGIGFPDAQGPACVNNTQCNGGVCVAGHCCASAAQACGDVCCPSNKTCFANACVTPGKICTSAGDCQPGQYCEPSLGPKSG